MVAAEARASGIPLIVPDRGATVDQLVRGAGTAYRAGSQISLERAISRFIDSGPEFQRAAAARAAQVRSMDEHFAELFGLYSALAPERTVEVGRIASELGVPHPAFATAPRYISAP
jgi:alpha-1,6-mannosyltransferase